MPSIQPNATHPVRAKNPGHKQKRGSYDGRLMFRYVKFSVDDISKTQYYTAKNHKGVWVIANNKDELRRYSVSNTDVIYFFAIDRISAEERAFVIQKEWDSGSRINFKAGAKPLPYHVIQAMKEKQTALTPIETACMPIGINSHVDELISKMGKEQPQEILEIIPEVPEKKAPNILNKVDAYEIAQAQLTEYDIFTLMEIHLLGETGEDATGDSLDFLKFHDLVRFDPREGFYVSTAKGQALIKHWKEARMPEPTWSVPK